MPYKLVFAKAASEAFANLDKAVQDAARIRLSKLAEDAESIKHLALTGTLTGLYKLRIYGKYRALYRIEHDQKRLIVVKIGNRDEIYKD
jgi:addiction module RelE/StbE family toxin